MSANFVPDAGTYFYTKRRPYTISVPDGILAVKTVAQTDNSYRGDVLLCIARDDHAIVTDIGKHRAVLPQDQWEFFPVGPEVLRCFGITQDGGAS